MCVCVGVCVAADQSFTNKLFSLNLPSQSEGIASGRSVGRSVELPFARRTRKGRVDGD